MILQLGYTSRSSRYFKMFQEVNMEKPGVSKMLKSHVYWRMLQLFIRLLVAAVSSCFAHIGAKVAPHMSLQCHLKSHLQQQQQQQQQQQ